MGRKALMILFKYILALLLTIPMAVLGRYLLADYFLTVSGKKQANQAAEKRNAAERKKNREKGFTIHIPDPIEQSDRNTHR